MGAGQGSRVLQERTRSCFVPHATVYPLPREAPNPRDVPGRCRLRTTTAGTSPTDTLQPPHTPQPSEVVTQGLMKDTGLGSWGKWGNRESSSAARGVP